RAARGAGGGRWGGYRARRGERVPAPGVPAKPAWGGGRAGEYPAKWGEGVPATRCPREASFAGWDVGRVRGVAGGGGPLLPVGPPVRRPPMLPGGRGPSAVLRSLRWVPCPVPSRSRLSGLLGRTRDPGVPMHMVLGNAHVTLVPHGNTDMLPARRWSYV